MILQDIPLALFFISFIILFLIGNFIYLVVLIRKNIKNKKAIKQTQIALERIQKTKEQIEQQGKEKILFFTSLIHELKVPLSIIRSSLHLYLQTSGNKFDKNLATLKANIESVSKDIISLLDAEKIEQMQFFYNHDSVLNISNAVKQEIEVFKSVTRKKEINMILSYEDSLFVKINSSAFAQGILIRGSKGKD